MWIRTVDCLRLLSNGNTVWSSLTIFAPGWAMLLVLSITSSSAYFSCTRLVLVWSPSFYWRQERCTVHSWLMPKKQQTPKSFYQMEPTDPWPNTNIQNATVSFPATPCWASLFALWYFSFLPAAWAVNKLKQLKQAKVKLLEWRWTLAPLELNLVLSLKSSMKCLGEILPKLSFIGSYPSLSDFRGVWERLFWDTNGTNRLIQKLTNPTMEISGTRKCKS